MSEFTNNTTPLTIHLAGIVPIAGMEDDFGLITPACLLPVDRAYTAIQKAVYECAMVGCRTIWIIANDDMAPAIKKVVGEQILDPVYYRRPTAYPGDVQRIIPIFYAPIHPKDLNRRDSYGWSVLYGVRSIWRTAVTISKWVVPEKYYVTFPMCAHNPYLLRKHRGLISKPGHNWFMTWQGKTVKDNMLLPFSMSGEESMNCRRAINKLTTREYINPPPGEMPSEKLPFAERWSARTFDFRTVFGELSEENSNKFETDWYYDISTYEGYSQYLGSVNFMKKPIKDLLGPRKDVKLPYKEGK